jgi:ureidoglycolate hydrolase
MERIRVESMESASFSRYGQLIDQQKGEKKCDTSIVTHMHDLGRLSSLGEEPVIAYVCAYRRPFVVDQLEKHTGTSEIFFPVDGMAAMVFADSHEDGSPDMETLAAFLITPGKPFISNKGVWHWVPFPVAETWDSYLLVEKDLVENDIEVIDLVTSVEIAF